jgi:hypothetical protein
VHVVVTITTEVSLNVLMQSAFMSANATITAGSSITIIAEFANFTAGGFAEFGDGLLSRSPCLKSLKHRCDL